MMIVLHRSAWALLTLLRTRPWEDPREAGALWRRASQRDLDTRGVQVRLSGYAAAAALSAPDTQAAPGGLPPLASAAFAAVQDGRVLKRALARWQDTYPQVRMWAATNPSVSGETAARWVQAWLDAGPPEKRVWALTVLRERPDLPLPASQLATQVFRTAGLHAHRLCYKVVQARRRSGQHAGPRTLLPANLDREVAGARADVVLQAFADLEAPPDPDLLTHVLPAFRWQDSGIAAQPLDALRVDVLNEGPYGARPRFQTSLTRVQERLTELPARLSDQLRRGLAARLQAACRPDPAAAAVANGLLPAGPTQRQEAECLFAQPHSRLHAGLPWWPYTYDEAVARASSCGTAQARLRSAAQSGVADADMLAAVPGRLHRELWLVHTGNATGPDGPKRRPPKQLADEAMAEVAGWDPKGWLSHSLNAHFWVGCPPPDLSGAVAVDDGGAQADMLHGMQGSLTDILESASGGLPERQIRHAVEHSHRPIDAMRALTIVR